jgi:hypothetical protein
MNNNYNNSLYILLFLNSLVGVTMLLMVATVVTVDRQTWGCGCWSAPTAACEITSCDTSCDIATECTDFGVGEDTGDDINDPFFCLIKIDEDFLNDFSEVFSNAVVEAEFDEENNPENSENRLSN